MKSHNAFILSIVLLFSTLISFTVAWGDPLKCGILAGQDSSNTTPNSTFIAGARENVNFNVNQHTKIVPHMIHQNIKYITDYFLFNDEPANAIRKVTFDGQVSNWDLIYSGTESPLNSPRGIAVFSSSHTESSTFVADYNNLAIRKIDASGFVTTFADLSSLIKPFAVVVEFDSGSLWILGDKVGSSGQSVLKLDSSGSVEIGLTALFSAGQCNGMAQDTNSYNLFFSCGSTIKEYDSSLTFVSDHHTGFTSINDIFLDPNGLDSNIMVVADDVVYNFDASADTSTLRAGIAGAYNGANDVRGLHNCNAVSFKNLRSAAFNPPVNEMIALTQWNVYIEFTGNNDNFNNAFRPLTRLTGLPNTLTLSFDNYDSVSNTLTVSFDLKVEYVVNQGGSLTDWFYTYGVYLSWWEVANPFVQGNATITVNNAADLHYTIPQISPLTHYYVEARYKTELADYSDPTLYEWGIQTQLFSGPSNFDDALLITTPGDYTNAQYPPIIDRFTFDPVGNYLYFADTSTSSVLQISVSSGTLTAVAGGTAGDGDGNGLSAEFLWPVSAAFDSVHRILYVLDGGSISGDPPTTLRAIDVDNGFAVTTLNSITGFTDSYIYAIVADNSGNLIMYTTTDQSSYNWVVISKNGATYSQVSTTPDDGNSYFYQPIDQLYFVANGDICENSGLGITSCLVVQCAYTQISSNNPPSLDLIYTVTLDTFLSTSVYAGTYSGNPYYDSIGVSPDGVIVVYSIGMGFGKYIPDMQSIAWLGGHSHSQEGNADYVFSYGNYNEFPLISTQVSESYSLEYAASAQYDVGHGYGSSVPPLLYPIGFDSDGNAYLLDSYNIRKYYIPEPIPTVPTTTTTTSTTSTSTTTTSTPTTSTSTTTSGTTTSTSTSTSTTGTSTTGGESVVNGSVTLSSQPSGNGYFLDKDEGTLNVTVTYNTQPSYSKLVLTDGIQNITFFSNPAENTPIQVPLAKANHTVTWQVCLIISVNHVHQSFCSAKFGVNAVPKVYHRVFRVIPQWYLSRTKIFTLPINDTDDDGAAITSITAQMGTVDSYSGITFTYTAPPYFNGTDRIDYTVCDDFNGCVTQYSNINVWYTAPNCSLDSTWKIPKTQIETHWTLSKLQCNTTNPDRYHFFANATSNDNKATFTITGGAADNSTIVMMLNPNHSGVVSWSFNLWSLSGETYPYTFSVHVIDNIPKIGSAFTQTWNHLTANNIPAMNLLTSSTDEDGDTCILTGIIPAKGATSSTVKQLDPFTFVFTTQNVVLQGSPDGTLQLLTAVKNGATYTVGAPVNVKTFKGTLAFQFSVGDGDLDQTANAWSTGTLIAQ
eukprot:TRINITY_DN2694_c0_g2_i2.p1 TRINITY_DN2694_c0_g2~~TRINITY_DN2694_c0_g2_i2.p1  ORF type:complete len:1320 (-),score=270.56 TRINITY_DN2694_c0_g2_i2:155-4114(-)